MARDDAARQRGRPSVTVRAGRRQGRMRVARAALSTAAARDPWCLDMKDLDMQRFQIAAAGLATLGLTACQSPAPSDDPSWTTQAVSIYRTEADALDVVAGRFGPVPLALERSADLVVLGRSSCSSTAVKVRNAQGVIGWTPASGVSDPGPCPLPSDPS